jgi:DNA-binding LacI/PurR family transcriptional regulator
MLNKNNIPVLWDKNSLKATLYQDVMHGMERHASKSKYQMVHYYDVNSVLKDTMDGDIIVLVGYESRKFHEGLSKVAEANRRIILAGVDADRYGRGRSISCVTPDRWGTASCLGEYMWKCGKKRLAIVGCGPNSFNDFEKISAITQFYSSCGVTIKPESIFYNDDNDIQKAVDRFTERYREFDSVICPNDFTALCLLKNCQDRGIKVPEDLYLATYSNRIVSKYTSPSITTTLDDYFKIGENAILAWRYLQNYTGSEINIRINILSTLQIRESTANQVVEHSYKNKILYNEDFQGDLFYTDRNISNIMKIEYCLTEADRQDLNIIDLLLAEEENTYEVICEKLFFSRSALNYRIKKIFKSCGVRNRKEFKMLFHEYFTEKNNFKDGIEET